MAAPPTRYQQLIEQVWQVCVSQFRGGVTEIILPINLRDILGPFGVHTIAERYSAIIGAPAVVFLDQGLQAIRMVRPATSTTSGTIVEALPIPTPNTQGTASTPDTEKKTRRKSRTVHQSNESAKPAKVPRPPNAFILYRQHHHPLVKERSPELHNNEISIILGQQWKNETPEVKDHFKAMADTIKRQHTAAHPEYQYQPRKPSEKKRRMTRRKAAALAEAEDSEPPANAADVDVQAHADDVLSSESPQSEQASVTALVSDESAVDVASPTDVATPVDAATPVDVATPSDDEPSMEELVAFEVPDESNDWNPMPGGLFNLNMPTDPKVTLALAHEFNTTHYDPLKYNLPPNRRMPTMPYGMKASESSAAAEEEALSLVDWDFINKQAAIDEAALARNYAAEMEKDMFSGEDMFLGFGGLI